MLFITSNMRRIVIVYSLFVYFFLILSAAAKEMDIAGEIVYIVLL